MSNFMMAHETDKQHNASEPDIEGPASGNGEPASGEETLEDALASDAASFGLVSFRWTLRVLAWGMMLVVTMAYLGR